MAQLEYNGNKLAFVSLFDVFPLQLFAEARLHASARPHIWPFLWDPCGWSDCSHLQCPGQIFFLNIMA